MNELEILKEKLNQIGIEEFAVIGTNRYRHPKYLESMKAYYNENQISGDFNTEDFNSIIVVLMNYHPGKFVLRNMSIGANEIDYHRVLKTKVEELSEIYNLGKFAGFTDTGPLFDRTLALEAGLGFIGKNGCLINSKLGSFVFIGYIFTDKILPLTEKKEVKNILCDSCTLCVKACPTKALSDERFEPTKCQSHLTQKNILREEEESMIKSFYGCDICQKVCPYNQDKKIGMKEFTKFEDMSYNEIFLLTNKEYKEKFYNRSFFWKSRKVIKRNAILKAINTNNFEIKDLIKMEKDKQNVYLARYIDLFEKKFPKMKEIKMKEVEKAIE